MGIEQSSRHVVHDVSSAAIFSQPENSRLFFLHPHGSAVQALKTARLLQGRLEVTGTVGGADGPDMETALDQQ
jgi:hypothetical protein